MREVKVRCRPVKTSQRNSCLYRDDCSGPLPCKGRDFRNKQNCRSSCGSRNELCTDYRKEPCRRYNKAPYICNGCAMRIWCCFRRILYDAKYAQKQYEQLQTDSSKGIPLTEEKLLLLNDLIIDGVCRELSASVVCRHRNINLHRGNCSERKESGTVLRVDHACHKGRSCQDYLNGNPDVAVFQMESVILYKGGKTLLTILFMNCDLQLMFLWERPAASSVTGIFQEFHKN